MRREFTKATKRAALKRSGMLCEAVGPHTSFSAWGVTWQDALQGCAGFRHPPYLAGCNTCLFATKAEARAHIREHWGYIATRPDLRGPPFNWRVPKPVRVNVTVVAA